MIIRNIILSCLTAIVLSGCGVMGMAVNATGKVVGSAFVAAMPNQGSDEYEE